VLACPRRQAITTRNRDLLTTIQRRGNNRGTREALRGLMRWGKRYAPAAPGEALRASPASRRFPGLRPGLPRPPAPTLTEITNGQPHSQKRMLLWRPLRPQSIPRIHTPFHTKNLLMIPSPTPHDSLLGLPSRPPNSVILRHYPNPAGCTYED